MALKVQAILIGDESTGEGFEFDTLKVKSFEPTEVINAFFDLGHYSPEYSIVVSNKQAIVIRGNNPQDPFLVVLVKQAYV